MLRNDADVRSMRAAIIILFLLLAHALLLDAQHRESTPRATGDHRPLNTSGYVDAGSADRVDQAL